MVVAHLIRRGLVSQIAGNGLEQAAAARKLKVYLGADPSAPSLHLGNLLPLMVLAHFYVSGHTAVPLVGGATGVVGDPSGRSTERSQQQAQVRARNVALIQEQFSRILQNAEGVAARYNAEPTKVGKIEPVNNAQWWSGMGFLDFLGTYGRHIRISAMLARESVRQRLSSEQGIGYAEFSYQVLQAFDFWHLYSKHGTTVQIGGHDQWGNITAGIDLIGRLRNSAQDPEPYGLTVPLLTTPSGEKFGKSAGNAVFLSSDVTKPFYLYQHLVRSPDEAVGTYLKMLTFVPLPEIARILEKHEAAPEQRTAQHRLAAEVTELVHGPDAVADARTVSRVLYDNAQDASPTTILRAFEAQDLVVTLSFNDIVGDTWKNVLGRLSTRSKSECQRLVQQRAIYVGLNRTPAGLRVETGDVCENGLLLVRVGKSEYYVVRLV